MVFVLANRVRETSLTIGTGVLSLAGNVTDFQTFVAGIGDGNTCYYCIEFVSGTEWEVGIGTVTDAVPDTLTRDTVLASSNAGALVNFSSGSKEVFVCHPAVRTIVQDDNGRTQIGDGTNYVEFLADGELRLLGTAVVTREIVVDLKEVNRSHANNPAEGEEDNFTTIDFDGTNVEEIFFYIHSPIDLMPGQDVIMHLDFFVDSVDNGAQRAVVWGLEYKAIQHGQVFDFDTGTSTVKTTVEIPTITADKEVLSEDSLILLAANLPGEGQILIRLYRDTTDGDDDHVGDVRVAAIHLNYFSDRLGKAI